MSNTGKGKKLASFNCDQKMWEQFIYRCQSKGTTATATLIHFIEMYLDGSLNNLDVVVNDQRSNNGLDSRIKEILGEYLRQNLTDNLSSSDSQAISDIYSRLDELQSQIEDRGNGNDTASSQNISELGAKIVSMTSRIEQLADAIIKIQNYLNSQAQSNQRTKSYRNNTYSQGYTSRMQPLTAENLAARLGVDIQTLTAKTESLQPPLFVAWSKGKDRSGVGWEFNQKTGLYYAVS